MATTELLQLGSYPDWDQTPLDAAFTVHRYDAADDKAALLAEIGPRVRGIATNGARGADRALIDACPNLEIVAVYGVGVDAVDLDACRAAGVQVTNTPDVLTEDVADLAVAMMLAQARGLVGADSWARAGHWASNGAYPLQRRVHGAAAGILGLGRIGRAIARRLAGFDMRILYSASRARTDVADWHFVADPEALARQSDFLFVAVPAQPETRHIVNRPVIEALGPRGMLINISRAANIDEPALLDALESGALGAAALDVFAGEPHLDARFSRLGNVLLQPHHASATVETRKAMGKLMRDNLAAHFAGHDLLTPVLSRQD